MGHVDLELDAETWSVVGRCLKIVNIPPVALYSRVRVFASSHGRAAGESWSSCSLRASSV